MTMLDYVFIKIERDFKFMKELRCLLGIHKYEIVGTQTAKNTVGGFSMIPLMRQIKRCKKCGKEHIVGFDISTMAHLDNTIIFVLPIKN